MSVMTDERTFEEIVGDLGPEWVLAAGPVSTTGTVSRRHLIELARCRGNLADGLTFVVTRPGRHRYVYQADGSTAFVTVHTPWVKPGDIVECWPQDVRDVT